ncbi:hypothetical protein BN946_scf184634.g3 [Trametes cinnabarina]|uniref:Uncharacterized protein n=1 Tax=Pycnoporus cinnabarinus TaxID=5643 RepID=A0A060SU73_PYCCI|nr:hypothetical protein BN946_scf184634.g3 [Trametes cinnabarina]
MDSRSPAEQEKDIRDLLRRAERTPVKTSALRRDALKRLIDLAHSPHSSLKVIAATNLKFFIKDFPELEEEAINAVYDLCEDPVSSVRIKGYGAIVDASREQHKWVKRNADVLVQLLQSDEPEEVTFVKRALMQHLDMDPAVTLGVLCDQVIPSDEPLDEEEQSIRDRLRSLVLAFLAGEAKRSLVERHASSAGSPAEEVLVSGLFKAIAKLSPNDVDVIVKDILAALPSFRSLSLRGRELLDVVLSQARATLKADLPSGVENGSLQETRYYLELSRFIAVERRLAPPAQLLRFYYTNLTPKLILGRLSDENQAYIIRNVAETFAASDERVPPTGPAADAGKRTSNGADATDDTALRKQFPEICYVLLQIFCDMKSAHLRPWAACHTLLQGIARRTRETRWQMPQHIISALRRVESTTAPQDAPAEAKAAQEQAHSVIRSLLGPLKSSATLTPLTDASASDSRAEEQKGNVPSTRDQRRIMNVNKRKFDAGNGPTFDVSPSFSGSRSVAPTASPRGSKHGLPTPPASLPPRPGTAMASPSATGTPSAPRADRQGGRELPHHVRDRPAASSNLAAAQPTNRPGTPSTSGKPDAGEGEERSSKRARTDGRRGRPNAPSPVRILGAADSAKSRGPASPNIEEPKPVPSLLSRLMVGASNGQGPASASTDREQSQRERNQGRRNRGDSEHNEGDPVVPAKRRAEPSTPSTDHGSVSAIGDKAARSRHTRGSPDRDPVGGYSIRGAARAANRQSPVASDNAASKSATSLLQRLQPAGEGGVGQSADDGGGRRGRKRGRHA